MNSTRHKKKWEKKYKTRRKFSSKTFISFSFPFVSANFHVKSESQWNDHMYSVDASATMTMTKNSEKREFDCVVFFRRLSSHRSPCLGKLIALNQSRVHNTNWEWLSVQLHQHSGERMKSVVLQVNRTYTHTFTRRIHANASWKKQRWRIKN